jgi:hypothetical protein
MLERLVLPPWLKAGLALPLLVLNLWVLRQLLLPLAPFPALFMGAALIAFLLDLPSRWLMAALAGLCLGGGSQLWPARFGGRLAGAAAD